MGLSMPVSGSIHALDIDPNDKHDWVSIGFGIEIDSYLRFSTASVVLMMSIVCIDAPY